MKRALLFCMAIAGFWTIACEQDSPPLRLRPVAIKPAQTQIDDKHDPRVITVKFRSDPDDEGQSERI